jgi:deazaflavin-dependent oxidoreductase (nitroreductase family)
MTSSSTDFETTSAPLNPTSPRPSLMHWLAANTIALARPMSGRRWFPLWAVLHHRGRKSGTEYATPIVARRIDSGFIIPIPFGQKTQWVRNVLAAGGATLRWKGVDHHLVDPQVIDLADASPAFSGLQLWGLRRAHADRFMRLRDAAKAHV